MNHTQRFWITIYNGSIFTADPVSKLPTSAVPQWHWQPLTLQWVDQWWWWSTVPQSVMTVSSITIPSTQSSTVSSQWIQYLGKLFTIVNYRINNESEYTCTVLWKFSKAKMLQHMDALILEFPSQNIREACPVLRLLYILYVDTDISLMITIQKFEFTICRKSIG